MAGTDRVSSWSLGYSKGDGSGPLSRLLRERTLSPVFQPIVSMADGSIYAHEALIRGPRGMPLHSPDALLAAASKEGLLLDFELACVEAALERWAALKQLGRLFLNLSASALLQTLRNRSSESVFKSVRELGIQPRRLVIEITEHEHVSDIEALADVAQQVHAAGVTLALDDFGDGRSSLRLWSELQPDIVKIDKYFTRDLSLHAKKTQTLRALLQIAEIFGTSLMAEGIENAEDLRIVRDLGVSLGKGFFIGRPDPAPCEQIDAPALQVLLDRRIAVMPTMRTASVSGRLNEVLTIRAPTVTSTADHDELAGLFCARPDLHAVAIVDDDWPVGLIDRREFMERYAKMYFKELYGKKPCITFANLSPRLIEREHDSEQLVGILTSQDQRYLKEGFIVTDNGRYVGLGTGDQLVRAAPSRASRQHAMPNR